MESTELRPVKIYVLVDPRTQQVRYCGQALSLKSRLEGHLRTRAGNYRRTHCQQWITQLAKLGLEPRMLHVDIADESTCDDLEVEWIAWLRECGFDLTNHTEGGGGVRGFHWKWSQESRDRLSRTTKGAPKPAGFGAKVSAGKKGKKHAIDHCKNISAAKIGKSPKRVRVSCVHCRMETSIGGLKIHLRALAGEPMNHSKSVKGRPRACCVLCRHEGQAQHMQRHHKGGSCRMKQKKLLTTDYTKEV